VKRKHKKLAAARRSHQAIELYKEIVDYRLSTTENRNYTKFSVWKSVLQNMNISSKATALFLFYAVVNLNTQSVTGFSVYSPNHVTQGGVEITKSNLIANSKLYATIEQSSSTSGDVEGQLDENILGRIKEASAESKQWAEDFDLTSESGAVFHALFSGIKSSAALGLKGSPFYLKGEDVRNAMDSNDSNDDPFNGFFTFDDLAKALEDDFLDATRGSTDNRQGWKVTSVSTPRGSSFEDARMTLEEVNAALEKGTVIFNTAGSHVPKLAGPSLACTDASLLPCAVNMYITAAGKRTSAPPHTDRQDVIVVQTQGKKRWRVYTPPNPSIKPTSDIYARGKGDDNLPLYSLEEGSYGCKKLLDITMEAGDVLFIPAAFPHTTDTVTDLEVGTPETTSIHLTFNFDTHVWDLNYLSVRRFALRRAGVADTALGQERDEDNRYIGNVNLLPKDVREDLMENLPLDFLDESSDVSALIDRVTSEAMRISQVVDQTSYALVPSSVWRETVQRIRAQGMELLEIHRDMYLAAIDEGRERKAEEAMTAHLKGDALARARALTPEKIQRLSLFRVQKYFETITKTKDSLLHWTKEGENITSGDTESSSSSSLPDDWEYTLPLKVGDQVEADLGGAFFPATVSKIGNGYDVKFFDGDVMNGLERNMIKLLVPPSSSASAASSDGNGREEPPPGLTKKELKRWRKKQEKKNDKKGF